VIGNQVIGLSVVHPRFSSPDFFDKENYCSIGRRNNFPCQPDPMDPDYFEFGVFSKGPS
jgi:hypothetical protein